MSGRQQEATVLSTAHAWKTVPPALGSRRGNPPAAAQGPAASYMDQLIQNNTLNWLNPTANVPHHDRDLAPEVVRAAAEMPAGHRPASEREATVPALFPDHAYRTLEAPDHRPSRPTIHGALEPVPGRRGASTKSSASPALLSYLQGIIDADPAHRGAILTGCRTWPCSTRSASRGQPPAVPGRRSLGSTAVPPTSAGTTRIFVATSNPRAGSGPTRAPILSRTRNPSATSVTSWRFSDSSNSARGGLGSC